MAGRGGCSLQSSVLAISVLYLLVLGLLLALATVLALDPGPGLATLLELVDTADSRLAGSAVAASVRGLVTSAQHHLALPLTLLVVLLAATVMLAAGAVFSRPLLLLPWLGNLVTSMSPSLHTCPPHSIYTRVLLTLSTHVPRPAPAAGPAGRQPPGPRHGQPRGRLAADHHLPHRGAHAHPGRRLLGHRCTVLFIPLCTHVCIYI